MSRQAAAMLIVSVVILLSVLMSVLITESACANLPWAAPPTDFAVIAPGQMAHVTNGERPSDFAAYTMGSKRLREEFLPYFGGMTWAARSKGRSASVVYERENGDLINMGRRPVIVFWWLEMRG